MAVRRSVLIAGLWLASCFTLPLTAQAAERIKFILDWAYQSQHAMFTIPADDGVYAGLNLAVQVDRGAGSGDTVAKVASGAYEMGVADFYSMLRFNSQNPDNKLIAIMAVDDRSALAVATPAHKDIKTPADLNGKVIAAPAGDASRQLFPLFAQANGIDEKSIRWNNVSVELREPILKRGDADAITGHLTTVTMAIDAIGLKREDVRFMAYSDYGVELIGHVVVARPEYVQAHPDRVRRFLRGAVQGYKKMVADPALAVASIKKRDPMANVDIELARLKMSLEYRMITPNVLKNGISSVSVERLQRSIRQVAPVFGIAAQTGADEVYTAAYLPERAELQLSSADRALLAH